MDARIPQKDPNYVDVIGSYHAALFVFAVFLIPIALVTAAGLLMLMILGVVLYVRRRKARLGDHEYKKSHIQLLITQFWRLSYLSILPLMLSATITSIFADASALQALRAKHENAETIPSDMEALEATLRYQQDNSDLIFWSNFLSFLPLLLYIITKTYMGYKAYKANEEVQPKSWGLCGACKAKAPKVEGEETE